MNISALLKLMDSLPDAPKIYRMNVTLSASKYLPENSIIMSADVADALEEAIRTGKDNANKRET